MNSELIYRKAIEKWGEDSQIIMVIEEMAELTKALTKWMRRKSSTEEIVEEIADVEIMLEQLRLIVNADSYIQNMKVLKLQRLSELIEKEKK